MEPLLEVKNITKRFGGLTAVDDVSLQIYPGEVIGILGDNGAGKSTLIKVISGVHHAEAGQIFFKGQRIKINSTMEALRIGIETIYQDLALAENMDVYSNIFLGREKLRKFLGLVDVLDHEYMQSESKKVLKRLEIEIPSLKNKIRNLSGGQRQAVAISRSIYWNAKLLIMDEPTAALGVPEQKKVLNLVKTLSSQGVSIIIISHQLHDVFAVATRLIIMRRAQKVAERITKKTSADEVVSLIVGSLPGDYN
ncbi:ABC transporter ATP-binding protein [Candidatus Atribacteria bacterium RBG_19FT_COMBO_35_14]|uniref:ABC transporter ATP-binding protein n=1 Tax=Candidatus Sediminicultor quintus TaxID=1797291 RepID=A0A1F5A6U3_9BACT|nr:MAG: ABC transporter ATP-binding protein [Candidatus Atribacteria bacterium RBG_19FT_COMBO_35_14]